MLGARTAAFLDNGQSSFVTGNGRDRPTGEQVAFQRPGVFRPLRIARSVNEFGWGTWELAARFSSTDFSDGDIDGGELDIYSLGANGG